MGVPPYASPIPRQMLKLGIWGGNREVPQNCQDTGSPEPWCQSMTQGLCQRASWNVDLPRQEGRGERDTSIHHVLWKGPPLQISSALNLG